MKIGVYQKTAFYKGMYILEKKKTLRRNFKRLSIYESWLVRFTTVLIKPSSDRGTCAFMFQRKAEINSIQHFLDTRIKNQDALLSVTLRFLGTVLNRKCIN